MLKLLSVSLLGLFNSSTLYAAGGASHGHITDLIAPAVNFFLLFGFIAFKMKKPLSDMFTKKATDVQELYDEAEEKNKEAQIKLDMYEKKMDQIESEKGEILKAAQRDSMDFEKTSQRETEAVIEKMKKDTDLKIESEKKQMIKTLSMGLIDQVINKAKESIKSDSALQAKVSGRLLAKSK